MDNRYYISRLKDYITSLDHLIAMESNGQDKDSIYALLSELKQEMKNSIGTLRDDVGKDFFYPAVYNSIATIDSVPPALAAKGQLLCALRESRSELAMIAEVIEAL